MLRVGQAVPGDPWNVGCLYDCHRHSRNLIFLHEGGDHLIDALTFKLHDGIAALGGGGRERTKQGKQGYDTHTEGQTYRPEPGDVEAEDALILPLAAGIETSRAQ